MGLSREEQENGFYAGFFIFLAGLSLLGLQIYWFLRAGAWTSLSFMDAMQMLGNPKKLPWVFSPQEWIGVHRLLDWIPIPGFLLAFGLLAMLGGRR